MSVGTITLLLKVIMRLHVSTVDWSSSGLFCQLCHKTLRTLYGDELMQVWKDMRSVRMSNTVCHSEHNGRGKRDGKTGVKISKPNCTVQYRCVKYVVCAYRFLSYYSVVRERVK